MNKKNRRVFSGVWRIALPWALIFLAACASSDTQAPPPAPKAGQAVIIRALDSMDRPIQGAEVTLTPLAGSPAGQGPYHTLSNGEANIQWEPEVVYQSRSSQMADHIFTLESRLEYRVDKAGFFSQRGKLEKTGMRRVMATPELRSLDRNDVLSPLVATVILHRPSELMAGELKGLAPDNPDLKKLIAFHHSMAMAARHLGVEFTWPAFSLENKHLAVNFRWLESEWAGLAPAPLKARVTAGAAMPLAVACGEELLPLKGVDNLTILVISEASPPDDPHALPAKVRVRLSGASVDYLDLAQGLLTPTEFLAKYPPVIKRSPYPKARPSLKLPVLDADGNEIKVKPKKAKPKKAQTSGDGMESDKKPGAEQEGPSQTAGDGQESDNEPGAEQEGPSQTEGDGQESENESGAKQQSPSQVK